MLCNRSSHLATKDPGVSPKRPHKQRQEKKRNGVGEGGVKDGKLKELKNNNKKGLFTLDMRVHQLGYLVQDQRLQIHVPEPLFQGTGTMGDDLNDLVHEDVV